MPCTAWMLPSQTLWWISTCPPLWPAASPLGCQMVGGNWACLSKLQMVKSFGSNGDPSVRVRPLTPHSRLGFWWSRTGCHPTPIPCLTIWDWQPSMHMACLTMSPDIYSWLETSGMHWGQHRLMGLDGQIVIPPGVGNQTCLGPAPM